MEPIFQRVARAAMLINERTTVRPEVALILGSGLGKFADAIDVSTGASLSYAELGLPRSTAPGHEGKLVLGMLEDRAVLGYQGRVHAYEGYSALEVVMSVHLAFALGVRVLIVTNACGGLNPLWNAGDFMLHADLINATGISPLTGPNDAERGPRFPVMFDCYDAGLAALAKRIARREGFELREGVYLGIQGPAYATRAEARMFRGWGGDAIGMSTVLEVIAARHLGMKVLGLSTVTDMVIPDGMHHHAQEQEVLEVAARNATRLEVLLRGVLAEPGWV